MRDDISFHSMQNQHQHLFLKNLSRFAIHTQIDIEHSIPSHSLHVYKSKSNTLTATYQDRPIHSKYNPIREAQELCKVLENKDFDSIIVWGMGLGYVLDEIIQRYPNVKVIVCEYNVDLFIALLNSFDYSLRSFVDIIQIYLNLDTQSLTSLLYGQNIYKPIHIVTPTAKQSVEIQKIEDITQAIHSYSKRMQININSIKKFRYRWPANIIKNSVQSFHNLSYLDNLKNAFRCRPTILCAGGPSLSEYKNMLLELQSHCIVICVDTALQVLKDLDIVPDFILVADPQYINTKHLDYSLDWAMSKSSKLIIDIGVYPRVLHLLNASYEGQIFVSIPKNTLAEQLLDSQDKYIGGISGGSIATFGIDICNILGITEIYTFGLDLSYPKKQSHSKGTYFERKKTWNTSRLNGIEHEILTSIFQAPELHTMLDYRGKAVYSDTRLEEYRTWIEEYLEHNSHIKIINTSPESGTIQGVEYVENILSVFKDKHTPSDKKVALTRINNFHTKLDSLRCQDHIQNIYKELQDCASFVNNLNLEDSSTQGARNSYNDDIEYIRKTRGFRLLEFLFFEKSPANTLYNVFHLKFKHDTHTIKDEKERLQSCINFIIRVLEESNSN